MGRRHLLSTGTRITTTTWERKFPKMKVLVLAALIAVAYSASSSNNNQDNNQNEWPWKVGKIYRYNLQSHNLAYLDGNASGNAFQAKFIVRVKAPGRLQARLENPQHAPVHQELPKKNAENQLPDNLKYEPVNNLEQPFEITLEGGRVKSLNLPTNLPLSHENLIKGLIGALQVDLSTHRNVKSEHDNYDQQNGQGQFRKMETDVTGDCETLYSVSPAAAEWRRELPNFAEQEEPMEITKSKSYGHCHHRVAYHFGVPEGADWSGTAHHTYNQQLLKRSTQSRLLVPKQGPIYKAETTSTIYVHPYLHGNNEAAVLSYIQVQLESYQDDSQPQWEIAEAIREIPNLLYSMSSKPVQIDENSSSSSSSSESNERQEKNYQQNEFEGSQNRVRRSAKLVTISKVYQSNNNNDKSSSSDSNSASSSDSSSAYVNDNTLNSKEPAYAAMYMNPQPHSDKKHSPMNAQKLVQEIAQQLQNPNNMPKSDFLSKFNVLVRVLSSMSFEQLTLTSRSIEVAKGSNNIMKADMWMIFRDAVTQAGTLPAFQQIRKWIQNNKIDGEEAAEVLATLPNTLRYPTKEAMMQFFNLAISDEVKDQMYLNDTALISATRFINMGQVNNATAKNRYPSQMYGRLARKHDNFVQENIIPRLRQELEAAIQQEKSEKAQVYIKAIGNLGHRSILDVFAPYLEGDIPVSTYLRVQMVENLDVLAHQQDHYARAVLYSILKNAAEPYEVRVMAIQTIFRARPSTEMMLNMAMMTHNDPSMHVRATLKSAIQSAAKLTHPRYFELARKAEVARSLLTNEEFNDQYYTKEFSDNFDSENGFGNMRVIDRLFPNYSKYSWKTQSAGWDNENTFSASFSNARDFMNYVRQKMNLHNRQPQQSNSDHKYSADKIAQMLNIKSASKDPLEASFFINLFGQQRIFAFGPNNFENLPATIINYLSKVSSGVEKHYTKVLNQQQVSIMVPIATGMPFVYKYKEPTVIHIQAKARGQVKTPSEANNDYSVSMKKEVHMTYARNIDGSVGYLDTLTDNVAQVGFTNKVQVHLPLNIELEVSQNKMKIHVEPQKPDQDTTIVHFSIWPYSAYQNKDSLVTVAQDPTTKVISRHNRQQSVDTRFGQATGTLFHLQGYTYSSDYNNVGQLFPYHQLIANMAQLLRQRDVALTHYNLRYLGKQSQNKRVTFTAVHDAFYNQKQSAQGPMQASEIQDVSPNSAARRQEMAKRVTAGINTAEAHVVDLSATFEGAQKSEYVLTAAIGQSQVDKKQQYAVFAARNNPKQGNNQFNAVATVENPELTPLNLAEALKKELRMKFEADIKYGQDGKSHIQVQGSAERTDKYTEELKNHALAQQSMQEIANNNNYQDASHKMIVMAHAPDHFKLSVTYKDISPALKHLTHQAVRIAEHLGFWYAERNEQKTLPEGKMEIEVQNSYINHRMSVAANSRLGELRFTQVPLSEVTASFLSTYSPFKLYERVANYYTQQQYQPYCTVDGNMIRTFSNRSYVYPVSRSWHVVVQDQAKNPLEDQLVILTRRPNTAQQEIYISYEAPSNQNFEVRIKPSQQGSNKPKVEVNTQAKKVSEGDLTTYWNEAQDAPLLQYYFTNGVLFLEIQENRLRAMYDGQRLVLLNKESSDIQGICGRQTGEPRDDYNTQYGIVDRPDHYGASYALNNEHSDPDTQKLQNEAKQQAYHPKNQPTSILNSNSEWKNAMQSSEETGQSKEVYRTRSYSKQEGPCQLHQQVQYYENHGEICITKSKLPACSSQCSSAGNQVQTAEVVCRPKIDQQQIANKNQIQQGHNPQVDGATKQKQFRVPSSCQG